MSILSGNELNCNSGEPDYGPDLLPQHARRLAESGISPKVAKERGYRSITKKADLIRLGFSPRQSRVPALLILIFGVTGEIVGYQIRPDVPRIKDGKALKYETPAKTKIRLDVPPGAQQFIGDPSRPLLITEGSRKADSAVTQGYCCISILGVWNWRGTNKWGGQTALADWESIHLKGRDIYIVFDSDVMTKPEVAQALSRLKALLESRGANVYLIYLPPGEGGKKVGLDDYLASGHRIEDLLALATKELRPLPESSQKVPDGAVYAVESGCLVWMKPTRDGPVPTRLTNFVASIISNVEIDYGDGEEPIREYDIEAYLADRKFRFRIPASRFPGMQWVGEHLGAEAVLSAGFGNKDHARAAIQILSPDIQRRRIFGHLGWRKIDDAWVFLHADGAIGQNGQPSEEKLVSGGVSQASESKGNNDSGGQNGQDGQSQERGVQIGSDDVALPIELRSIKLPAPPQGEALRAAIRSCLKIPDLAPETVTVPLFIAPFRTVLGGVDFSLHQAGPTGARKTELVALAQQHFGCEMDARSLPANWESTDNALEALAFVTKDSILVIDDFAPTGTPADVQRLHRKADRVMRGQGNRSGRQRMRSDITLRAGKPPRGLILSTGEDVPNGQSLRARMLVSHLPGDSVDLNLLTQCQADARAGLYSQALAGFIQWLAPQYEEIQGSLQTEIARIRDSLLTSGQHPRTSDIIASLGHGLEVFLSYALEVGAIDEGQAEELRQRCWKALREAGADQAQLQADAEPTSKFLELLSAAITSGRAHVADEKGNEPPNPQAWGWRKNTHVDLSPGGRLVGWIDGDDLYLDAESAYAAAQGMGREGANSISISSLELRKRLAEKGLLKSFEKARGYRIRKSLQGKRRTVLHISAAPLLEPGHPDQSDHGPVNDSDEGAYELENWPDPESDTPKPGQNPADDQPEAIPEGIEDKEI